MKTAKQCAQLILDNQEKLISSWVEEVRKNITGSQLSTSLGLQNHLPKLLIDIAQVLIEKSEYGFDHKNDEYLQMAEKTKIHGENRAKTKNYSIDQVIREYSILHRQITDLLQENGILSVNIVNILKYLFEKAMERSARAFSASIHETQDKLIGALAHDIRNPLSVALLSSELLTSITEEEQKLLTLVKKSLKRSLHLTEGILDTLSLKSGEGMMMDFTSNDYTSVVSEACRELKDVYTDRIVYHVPKDQVSAIFDIVAIKRVIENLVSNAIKYGDSSGTIYIFLEDEGENVNIRVKNFGNPIPKDKQKSIFKFLQHYSNSNTSPSQTSWGIGLSLVKTIVDAHQGTIKLTSTVKGGTTFLIMLKKALNFSGKTRMELSTH